MYQAMISEIAKNKEVFKPSFDEVNKKMSPNELLKSSENFGISGDKSEINNIEQEVEDGSKKIKTRNEDLEGREHPVTGVPYEKDTLRDGREGVFPKFPSIAEVQLPEELYQETDAKQFRACNEDLKEQIKNNPELRAKFTPEQIEQIENGRTPSGYTWHHHQQDGKMQLVETEVHDKSGHTGGKVLWGGGQENR
ncbi:MAG: HNH endonuclease [Aliarcobacter skirrowii]|uniref:HNH endonuclease n=1 Tax=Aliarcobacter skirrowii TaxID=28200 RepID=UPI00242F92C9|nr:HNH endonuclease [Aliarcobacter skirrowii]MDD2507559.1 HNH endonuclease [Aliarcobacter skirrowii]MDD3495911.1 HNH endonuclease [Aliarcobacter skirrowii]